MNRNQKLFFSCTLLCLIVFSLSICGCVSNDNPESAIISALTYIDNGEYEKATDLFIDTNSMTKLSEFKGTEEYSQFISFMNWIYGESGEKVKAENIQVINKEKIDENTYIVTVSYMMRGQNDAMMDDITEEYPVIKVDGEWLIAYEI